MNLNKNNFLNYSILIPYLILAGIGIVMVFSTTVPDQLQKGLNPYKLVINQTAFVLLSLIMIAVIYRLKLRALKNRKMIGTIMVILILSFRFRWLRLAISDLPWNTLIEQHKEILCAVENHDGEKAVTAAAKHLHLMFDEEMAVLQAFPEYFDNLPE